jgi:hypothetical protein
VLDCGGFGVFGIDPLPGVVDVDDAALDVIDDDDDEDDPDVQSGTRCLRSANRLAFKNDLRGNSIHETNEPMYIHPLLLQLKVMTLEQKSYRQARREYWVGSLVLPIEDDHAMLYI